MAGTDAVVLPQLRWDMDAGGDRRVHLSGGHRSVRSDDRIATGRSCDRRFRRLVEAVSGLCRFGAAADGGAFRAHRGCALSRVRRRVDRREIDARGRTRPCSGTPTRACSGTSTRPCSSTRARPCSSTRARACSCTPTRAPIGRWAAEPPGVPPGPRSSAPRCRRRSNP